MLYHISDQRVVLQKIKANVTGLDPEAVHEIDGFIQAIYRVFERRSSSLAEEDDNPCSRQDRNSYSQS